MHPVNRLRAALPADASRWLGSHGADLAAAWRACPQPDWLLRMSISVDLDRSLLVHAAADLAGEALAAHRVADLRPRQALTTALRWIAGRAESSEAWAVGFAASEVADRFEGPAADAIRAASHAAFACDDRADAAFYAHRAYAARAATHAARAIGDPERAADVVRHRIPLSAFLAAFDVASRPPPPLRGAEAQAPPSDSFYC
jgi:hypothetical protein